MQPLHQNPNGRMEFARASALTSRQFPWLALAGSLIVHAITLMLVSKASFQERTIEPSDRIITMHLAPLSPREPERDLERDLERELPITDPQLPLGQQDPADANTYRLRRPRRSMQRIPIRPKAALRLRRRRTRQPCAPVFWNRSARCRRQKRMKKGQRPGRPRARLHPDCRACGAGFRAMLAGFVKAPIPGRTTTAARRVDT